MRKQLLMPLCALPLAAMLALGGCADNGQGGNEVGGTLAGAAVGGLVGSQFGWGSGRLAMTAAGTLLGAYIGNSIGRQLDEADRIRMEQAERRAYAAPLNQPIIWDNPNTGNSGSITAIRDGQTTSGLYCREFQSEVTVGGQKQSAHGTACREPDGSWRIVNG